MSLRHIKAVNELAPLPNRLRLFLGGSIEMGKAEMWQERLVEGLASQPFASVLDVYNPRRDDWDSSWPNSYDFSPFKAQVDWELEQQSKADLIVYYFAADTLSPITLLELGLFYKDNPVIGVDPDYLRIGNILVTRDHFGLDVHEGWDAFVEALNTRLQSMYEEQDKA